MCIFRITEMRLLFSSVQHFFYDPINYELFEFNTHKYNLRAVCEPSLPWIKSVTNFI